MLLSQVEAWKLLSKYNISLPKQFIIDKNLSKINNIKYPVALKVDSPDIIHKSDTGLVFLNLRNKTEVKEKLRLGKKILKKSKVKDSRFIVQQMVSGLELIVGVKQDDIFGPVVVFGIGGVFVEALKDISMRVTPLKKKDCLFMINEIRGSKLLEGYRNIKVNKDKIIDLLMKTSQLAITEKDISELDFNPVIATDKKAIVVDARIIKNVK